MEMFLANFGLAHASRATDEDVELRDVRDGHVVWSRSFPHEVPALSFSADKVLLTWPLTDGVARDELSKFPQLKNTADKDDCLVEQIDLEKNAPVGAVVIKTNKGSFSLKHAFSHGDWVIATASGNQVLAYSLSTGQEKSHAPPKKSDSQFPVFPWVC